MGGEHIERRLGYDQRRAVRQRADHMPFSRIRLTRTQYQQHGSCSLVRDFVAH
jgi:hypothetical protein